MKLVYGLMLASGFAGLGYQIVWTQQSALWLGHETAAVLAVVAAFFGGLAAGALALGQRIERSARPARWYAGCEAVIGGWSVVLALVLAPASGWLLDLTGAQPSAAWQWTVAFVGTFLLLLPATAAMGATLPAMERTLARAFAGERPAGPTAARDATTIAALYAGNTFGAVIGVLASAFWLVPAFGLTRTSIVCAALNGLCALAALKLFAASPSPVGNAHPAAAPDTRSAIAAPGVLPRLAMTGLLGIGYEVLVVRVLSQVSENTVYTFAMLLAVYLVGSASGAAFYERRLAGRGDAAALADRLLWLLALACLAGTGSLWGAEAARDFVADLLGAGMGPALAAEAALAVAAFALPTVVMGALFSHLATQARHAGIGFGRALGVNTLGAAAAPLLFGVLLVPAVGPKAGLLTVAAGYLVLSSRPAWLSLPTWATASVALLVGLAAPPLAFVDVPEGGRIVSYREGPMAAVSIVEDAGGVSRLRINNRQQEGSSATLLADGRQALLPLLLHPAPRHALFLGLGTGMTASSAAEDRQLQVDAVELLPEVIEASAHFTQAFDGGPDGPSARLHLKAADARRYVRAHGQAYDLIVADNFHPARSGSGSLYTVEHFEAVRGRLAPGGLFCQWLPLHQLDLPTLRSIVRAFMAAYPGGWAMLATNSLETPTIGLVGNIDGRRFDIAQVRQRMATAQLPTAPADFGLNDEYALMGSFVAGPAALVRFAGDAALNTDDHPVVAYRAPRITYAPDSLPRDRLMALLAELQLAPAELIDPPSDGTAAPRLAAYWKARDQFIEAGRQVQPSGDVRRMLAQVQAPLLAALHTSPDFRPAYDPLLQMAGALARTDVAAAQALLDALARAQPARPEAQQALQQLGSQPPAR